MFNQTWISFVLTSWIINDFELLYNKQAGMFYQVWKHEAIAECFIQDKTNTASLLIVYENEPFRKFIDVKILKIDLVWAVKSMKKFIENGKRSLLHMKTFIKHAFILFYLRGIPEYCNIKTRNWLF